MGAQKVVLFFSTPQNEFGCISDIQAGAEGALANKCTLWHRSCKKDIIQDTSYKFYRDPALLPFLIGGTAARWAGMIVCAEIVEQKGMVLSFKQCFQVAVHGGWLNICWGVSYCSRNNWLSFSVGKLIFRQALLILAETIILSCFCRNSFGISAINFCEISCICRNKDMPKCPYHPVCRVVEWCRPLVWLVPCKDKRVKCVGALNTHHYNSA